MWCGVITLFPEMFRAITDYGITGRAVSRGLLTLNYWNPRDFAKDKHKTVDERPYGGGPGMVMAVPPLREAIQAARKAAEGQGGRPAKTIYVSPQGQRLNHAAVLRLSKAENLIFVAGRYEGIDERLIQLEIDEEWSIGDYVLSGGELAVMVMIDALSRFLPGALGDEASVEQDSFVDGLLDCPHYTRPEWVENLKVPEVLLSGDHAKIEAFRRQEKLGRTYQRRPDLLESMKLSDEEHSLLQAFIKEQEK